MSFGCLGRSLTTPQFRALEASGPSQDILPEVKWLILGTPCNHNPGNHKLVGVVDITCDRQQVTRPHMKHKQLLRER